MQITGVKLRSIFRENYIKSYGIDFENKYFRYIKLYSRYFMKKRTSAKGKLLSWSIIVLLIIVIKVFSANPGNVEKYYSTGIYIYISLFFRSLFGWIPFSFGDILYFLAGSLLLYYIIMNIILLFQRKYSKAIFLNQVLQILLLSSIIYVLFNVFWGINYNRKGIADQLHLKTLDYDSSDLLTLQSLLLHKVNETKTVILRNKSVFPENSSLFLRAKNCYMAAEKKIPFLQYRHPSVKSSLYGWFGNYMGYTGYYNPFTGEAQVNTTVPLFLQPDIAVHEMGHQLGYAKEDEASFAGYLAAVNSTDTVFHYSTYLSLFLYTNRDVYSFDSIQSKNTMNLLLPAVKQDVKEWRDFDLAHQGYLEPALTWLYSKYLKINQQPKGLRSYNQVVVLLLAYYKKYGVI